MRRRLICAALGLLAIAISLAPAASASSPSVSVNVCRELANGIGLAALEMELGAAGYSAPDAGTYAGNVIREHCPELIPFVKAQLSIASGSMRFANTDGPGT